MGWALTVNSTAEVEGGWEAEARRLRSQLDIIGSLIEREYQEPVVWRSETMTAEQWNDIDAIVAEILKGRMRDEDEAASVVPGASSSGLVQAWRGEGARMMATCLWRVGGTETATRFFATYDVDSGAVDQGTGRELDEHEPDWLAELVCASASAVDGPGADIRADIRHPSLRRALRRARREAAQRLGALTLLPEAPLADAVLPASVSMYPCASDGAARVVIAADLDRVVADPQSLVADLVAVDDLVFGQDAIEERSPE